MRWSRLVRQFWRPANVDQVGLHAARYFRRSIDLLGCSAAVGRTRKSLLEVVNPVPDA